MKLCICGHPATSHEPAEWAIFSEDDRRKIVGSYWRLMGPCLRPVERNGFYEQCACKGFKTDFSTESKLSEIVSGRWESICRVLQAQEREDIATMSRLIKERDEARKALETLRAVVSEVLISTNSYAKGWAELSAACAASRLPSSTPTE